MAGNVLDSIIAAFEAHGLKVVRRSASQAMAQCPLHHDQHPSVSLTETADGRVLVHDFGGCATADILQAVGLSFTDLNPNGDPLTVLASAKRLPVDFLRKLGWKTFGDAVAIPYQNPQGETFYQYRHGLERRYSWQKGAKASELVYGLAQLSDDAQEIWVCESAVDAATLQFLGISAIAVAGKGNARAVGHFADRLVSIPTIIAWQEPDASEFTQQVANTLQRPVFKVTPENGAPKDANRLWLACNADPNKFLAALKQLKTNAVEIAPQITEPIAQKTTEQQSQCPFCELTDSDLLHLAQPVLESDRPLEDATQRIVRAFGIVGEDANIKLLLLALTSRVFPQPISVLVTGGTGQGKSFLTDAVCATLPPCSHRRLVGASARALLFHPIAKQTVLQWLEMPDIGSDTIAATILRSILWQSPHETVTDYLFVEWTAKGVRRRTVRMPRQIALITTRVELPKDEQLLSRFLVLEVRESTDKRTAVFSAIAEAWNGNAPTAPEDVLQPIKAFHHWLGGRQVKVTIPYATTLAQLFAELPPAERDFRDFSTLLKLIAACALWHFHQRQHSITENTLQVTADIMDYALVWELLTPIWGKPRTAGLSEAERRVAETLRELSADSPPTAQDIARQLGIADGAVRTHLENLARKGLVERGEKQGRAWTWRLVGDLDTFAVALPTVEAVLERWRPDPAPTQPTAPTPEPDSPTDQPDPRSAKALTSANEPLALKSPVNTGTFAQPLKRYAPNISGGDYTTLNARDNASENSADEATEEGIKNRYRFSACAKTPVNTGEFSAKGVLALRSALAETNPPDLPDQSPKFHTDLSQLVEEVKWVCPNGHWRKLPPDAALFGDPLCKECGQPMTIAPDEPKPPSDDSPPKPSPENEPEGTGSGFIDTETWLAQAFGQDQPIVYDLETNEPTPVPDFPPVKTRPCKCVRCGHEGSADGLLPPPCPICGTGMVWEAMSDAQK